MSTDIVPRLLTDPNTGNVFEDLSGTHYSKLTVEAFDRKVGYCRYWWCQCACGSPRKSIRENHLKGKNLIVSCGCHRASLNRTHGMSDSPEHVAWMNMVARCTRESHPQYADYGGRGISVCDRWLESFENFFADMGLRPSKEHTLEREKNHEGYEPGNVIWATMAVQSRNKRNNALFTIDGETLTLMDWCLRYKIDYGTVRWRMRDGSMSIEEALTAPVNPMYSRHGAKRTQKSGGDLPSLSE